MQNQPKLINEETLNSPLTLTKFQELKEKRASSIVAQVIISESELDLVIKDYNSNYEIDRKEEFEWVLYTLGLDIDKGYQRQDTIQHRNRLNQIVICSRYVGEERQDDPWILSGYASKEARDKHSGSRILEDLYRERSCTTGIQEYLEARDKYAVIDTTVWINK